ncbi:MAG: O-methyltransferase [Bacteroidales bacterium]|nr:O-methyltransferase [Bacteroidales bacterium]
MDITPELEKYILKHISTEGEVLHELYRKTNLEVVKSVMISGHWQGQLLEMLSKMIQPETILEIGTFTGYSAICLAKGLKPGGILHTIERNDELIDLAQSYIEKAGMISKIKLHIGEALSIINSLNIIFDLVFIDADKWDYLPLYQAIFPKLKGGGYVLADNILWSGKVIGELKTNDKETKSIIAFNDFIANDTRVDKVIIPIRDGLTIIRKK